MFERLFNEIGSALSLADEMDEVQGQLHQTMSASHQRLAERLEGARGTLVGHYADRIFAQQRAIAARSRLYLQHLATNRAQVQDWKRGLREEADTHEHGIRVARAALPDFVWEFLDPQCQQPTLQNAARFGSSAYEHPAVTFARLVPAPQPGPAASNPVDTAGRALAHGLQEVAGLAGGLLGRIEQVGMDFAAVTEGVRTFGDRLFAALDWTHLRMESYTTLGLTLPCCQTTLMPFADGAPETYSVPGTRRPPHDLRELYQMIDYQYGRHGGHAPIGITPVGDNTLLVTLAGVEQIGTQSNKIVNAAIAGSQTNATNDIYAQDVNAAIDEYIQGHTPPLKPPVRVIIAGHSYGGIVGQELAANNTDHRYNVTDVMTFGSPEVGPRNPNVRYTQYATEHDIVPLLSNDEAAPDIQKHYQEVLPLYEAQDGSDPGAASTAAFEAAVDLTTQDIFQLNASGDPRAIQQWTAADGNPGETVLTDQASMDALNRSAAHGAYLQSSQLASVSIPPGWNLSDAQWGQTQYFTVTQHGAPQNLYDPSVQPGLQNLHPTPVPVPGPTQGTPTPGNR